jgi:hypothetical protein
MTNNLFEYILNFIENENLKYKIKEIFTPLLEQIINKFNPYIYVLFFFSISNFITNLVILYILIIQYKKFYKK